MDVGLVPGIENDCVRRRAEDSMKRNGEFNNAKVRSKVPPSFRDVIDQFRPNLFSKRV